jgi:DNA helicase IV
VFLRYISQVLPSLGEAAVTQLTVAGLAAPRLRERGVDPDDVAAVKGDARMAAVIDRLTVLRIRPPTEPVAVPLGTRSVRIDPDIAASVIEGALASGSPRNDAREGVLRQLAVAAVDGRRRRRDDPTDDMLRSRLAASAEWRRAVDRIWPSQSAPALLRELYGNRRVRQAATAGVLTGAEADGLARRPAQRVGDEPWTLSDLVLLDELEHRLNGTSARYGHGVVDEAQDLSAMALRMVARRVPTRSLTVLGDLAQATAPACQLRWEDALVQLGGRGEVRELQLGYRLPAPILDFASRLLPAAAPHVRPSRSVRLDGQEPHLTPSTAEGLGEATAEVTARLAAAVGTVGVIVPLGVFNGVRHALEAAGLDVAHGGRGLETPVTLVDALTAKGLEFDAVVVVEPARFVALGPAGVRLLYIALTRAVQELVVVHAQPLPAELVGAGWA